MTDSARNTTGMIMLAALFVLAGNYCISAYHTQVILEAIQTHSPRDVALQLPAPSGEVENSSVIPEEFRQQIGDEFRKMWLTEQPNQLTPVTNANSIR